MIRTDTVTLTAIPATAYRQKLPAGGSGIVILREGARQPGIASLSKTSGEAIPTANTPAKLYPKKAFDEAIALTAGLSYSKRSAPAPAEPEPADPKAAAKAAAMESMAESAEYGKIVEHYTDKTGRFSYELLNKDLIQLAHRSSKVREMIEEKATLDRLRIYVVGTKFRTISGNHDLSNNKIRMMVELLDGIYPKSVLKELTEDLKQRLKR